MTGLLLDTHVLLWANAAPERLGRNTVAEITQIGSNLFVSAVTIGEIQAGIELTREQDQTKAGEIETWLEQLAASYNVLPMDASAFRAWARLMHRKSDTLIEDAMIAATARSNGLTVATRNVADFKALGVAVFNPFARM